MHDPDFPSLSGGGVYLDSAAKTLTCRAAIDAMQEYYLTLDANMDRGVYPRAALTHSAYEEAREAVASMVSVPSENLFFSSSTTEAINTIALGLEWKPGDRVVTTVLEHHSNFLPWLQLREKGVEVTVLPSNAHGFLDPDRMASAAMGARLVTFTHASNAIGSIQDAPLLARAASADGAFVLVDGAQAVSHRNIDVGAIGADAYAFSGHKCFGPTGTAALYLSRRLLDRMRPSVLGSGSVSDSSIGGYTLKSDRPVSLFEPGTRNIAGCIGFGAAASWRGTLDWQEITSRVLGLTGALMEGLSSIPGVDVFGPDGVSDREPLVSFALSGQSPHQTALLLGNRYGIMVRSGHHCALPLWKELYGRPAGAVRASMHAYTHTSDVEALLTALYGMARRGV